MNKLKTLCIAALLLFTVNAALAQDKYEYASIAYARSYGQLEISINGTEFKKIEVPKDELKVPLNINPVLREVSKMNAEGWELFHVVDNSIFYLRKKVS
jgi:hypothetical protein